MKSKIDILKTELLGSWERGEEFMQNSRNNKKSNTENIDILRNFARSSKQAPVLMS